MSRSVKRGTEFSIEDLEKLAAEVLDLKERTRPKRPILIEFCGSPKSGKSSCIESLDIFLRRNGFRTRILTERASVCPIGDKFDPRFNVWTAAAGLAEMVEATWLGSDATDVIIADRGIFDALTWFRWLRMHGNLDDDNYRRLTELLIAPLFRAAIDLIYVFRAKPEVSMGREYAHLLTRKEGTIMNTTVLSTYLEAIDESIADFAARFRKVERIDTSSLEQNAVSYQVSTQILESLRDLTVERIGWIARKDVEGLEGGEMAIPIDRLGRPQLSFGYRPDIEDRPECVQPIPVLVLLTKGRQKILVVKKRDQSTSDGSPERNKTLAYAGGHVREEDQVGAESDDIFDLSRIALEREVKEELGISLALDDSPMVAILDPSHPTSARHIALVYVYEIEEREARVRLDTYEFVQKRGVSKSGRFLPIDEAISLIEREGEAWSRAIIGTLLDRSMIPAQLRLDS